MPRNNIHIKYVLFVLFISLCIFNLPASAQGAAAQKGEKPGKIVPPVDEGKLSKLSVTRHSIMIDGKPFRYKATTGYMLMKNDKGKLEATIFFIAYTKETKGKNSDRPITFSFNGGPGSASLWLHMGALGPKRILMSPEGFQLPQPFRYVDNPYTWLPFTDLVFIDPVSTGYSRAAAGVDRKKFHGLNEDIASVGHFVQLYVSRYERWLSPKFICGESYGTTRAAGLSGHLQDLYGMYIQGLVLVSSVLDFQTTRFETANDAPPALYLPTYTAAAWYHKKLKGKYAENLEKTLKEVEEWVISDYWLALAKGDSLPDNERQKVIEKLSQFTGLPKDYIDQQNLRINIFKFTQELLKTEKKRIGRLDARFKCGLSFGENRTFNEDPSYSAIYGPYTAGVNDYLRRELKFKTDRPYWPISHLIQTWNWDSSNKYVNVAEILRDAIIKNNNLKVMIANGYYDLATPYFATKYTVNHLALPKNLSSNIRMEYYRSGHMMYIKESCLKKLYRDTLGFYKDALGSK